MTTLTILHLTDLHRGLGGYAKFIYPNVEQILLGDLELMHERTGPWDLVCFTGDLVYSGGGGKDGKEFEQFQETLGRLWDVFGRLGSKDAQLLTVPGNHDLHWPDARQASVKVLKQWRKDPEIQASFWEDDASEYRAVVNQAFASYTAWEEENPFRSLPVQRGLLPGDFCLSFEKEGWKIGVVGLNTAFLQLGREPYEGKLALHPAQLAAFHGDRYAAWFKEHHVCLLLTHHPPEWLAPAAREEYTANIAPSGRFLAHLCGHLHVDRREDISIGGAHRPRLLRGASLFGLEFFGKRIQREHGYAILKLELDPAGATWRRWPRGGIKIHGGEWKIARNEQAEKSFEGDDGTPAEAFQVQGVPPRRTMAVHTGGVGREPATPPASPVSPEDLERLRQTLEDTMAAWRRITARIWQRLHSHVIYDGKEMDFKIEAQGDTTVTSVYSVESSQTVPFVPFEIAGDETSPEVHHLDELGFQVRLVGRPKRGDEVLYLLTDNFPRRKRLALFFFPEIDARQRKIEIRYRWPGLSVKLIQQGTLDWAFGWRRPVGRGEIRFRFAAELGEVDCKLVSGQGKGVTLSRHYDKEGCLVWTCRCRDAPAGDYQFTLKRTSNHP